MKMKLLTIVLAGLLLSPAVFAQKKAGVGSVGFGISGGLGIPASGDITPDSTLSDFFDVGPIFGAQVSYIAIEHLTLRAGFDYAFMKSKDEVQIDFEGEPYLTLPYLYVDGIWNLGALMNSPDNIINPYLSAGGGLYFWKVTDDGAGGDALILENEEEFSATSFGLQFGAGVEVFATPQLSLFAEGKYHMIFTEDTDTFGDDFSNIGFIGVKAGLTYYLPLGSE